MAEKQTIDYSNLSLPDVINRKIRRKATFLELVPKEKRKVFKYIKKHNIELEPKKILQINIIVNGSIDLIIDYLKNRVDYETDVIYSTILDEVKGLNLF